MDRKQILDGEIESAKYDIPPELWPRVMRLIDAVHRYYEQQLVCGKQPAQSKHSEIQLSPCMKPAGHQPAGDHESAQYQTRVSQSGYVKMLGTVAWSEEVPYEDVQDKVEE